MIKNIIFDLGNVLIKYTPENFLENNVKKERQEKFIETVFKSKEWLDLDKGTLSYENAIEKFAEIIPEERENLEKLFKNNIMECLMPIEENIQVLKKLKDIICLFFQIFIDQHLNRYKMIGSFLMSLMGELYLVTVIF